MREEIDWNRVPPQARNWVEFFKVALGRELIGILGLNNCLGLMASNSGLHVELYNNHSMSTMVLMVNYKKYQQSKDLDRYVMSDEEAVERVCRELAKEMAPAIALLRYNEGRNGNDSGR